VKMVEQWTSKHKVVGSTPATFYKSFFFIHTFIIYSIHKVFPAVVEACYRILYFSIAQSKGAVPAHAGFEPIPLLGPTIEIKLCMVYI
jgi:hypothetical protein